MPSSRKPGTLLSSECPNCGRLHSGFDFNADPGPVQVALTVAEQRAERYREALEAALPALIRATSHAEDHDIKLRSEAELRQMARTAQEQAREALASHSEEEQE